MKRRLESAGADNLAFIVPTCPYDVPIGTPFGIAIGFGIGIDRCQWLYGLTP